MKQFVKSQNSEAFQYLKNLFPKLSEAKVKTGILIGLQIKKYNGMSLSGDSMRL